MACRRGFNSQKNKKNNQWSKKLFSLSVVSSRYNIERHNFPQELSLNVVSSWLGFIGLCTQAGVERAPGIGDWEEGKKGGTLGRKASFDFIVIKSANEKSRENNKQTDKQTARKRSRERRVKNFKEKRRVGEKKNEHEICRMALRTSETIRPRFVCPIELKA